MADKERLVAEDGLAVSPFDKWPGHIKFPEFMTLPHYRLVVQHRRPDDEAGSGDEVRIIMRIDEGEDGRERYIKDLHDLPLVGLIAEVVSVHGGDVTSENAPYQLVFWALDALEEWLDRQFSFRYSGSSNVEK